MATEDIEITEAKVTYTTKELLKRIDDRFERLESLVTNQPTRLEFDALYGRVALIETEQVGLRRVATALKDDKASRFNKQDKLVLGVFAAITTVLNTMAAFNLGPFHV